MANINNKSTINDRMRMNPLLSWLSDMISIMKRDEITIPTEYRERVLEVKQMLNSDVSGIVNSVLDFAIDSALVDYTVETTNKNLTNKLNDWLVNINDSLRGHIPIGIKALAKEYFRERWKGSSYLLLRTFWETKDGFSLPTTMYFIDGEDIIEESKNNSINLQGKNYYLRIDKDDRKQLGTSKNEKLFIQKPFTSWGQPGAVPFLLQRGVYKNLKFLELVEQRGESMVAKALEYIAMLKKGTETLAMTGDPNFVYSDEDLKEVKTDFDNFLAKRKTTSGTSMYATNFDTSLEHIIPEYHKVLAQELYSPIERRILAGLGMIDVVQGLSSTRRESTLNPKPLFSEVKQGIEDFKALLLDIMNTVADENGQSHRKYFRQNIQLRSSIVREELTDKDITQIRSGYDRGIVSKQTYSEILGFNFNIEIERRKDEEKEEKTMYPPVIQNLEQHKDFGPTEEVVPNNKNTKVIEKIKDLKNEDIPDDKKSIEKKNYNKSELIYEEAPFKTNQDLPEQVQLLPAGAKTIWRKAFNSTYDKNGEESAIKIAWSAVKKIYKKVGDNWVRRTKGELEQAFADMEIDELIELKELEILGKRNKLLDKLLEEK